MTMFISQYCIWLFFGTGTQSRRQGKDNRRGSDFQAVSEGSAWVHGCQLHGFPLTSNGQWKNAGWTRQVGVSQPVEPPDLSMGSEAWSKHRRFPDQWRLAEERREPHQWRSDHGQKLQMVRGHVSRIKVTLSQWLIKVCKTCSNISNQSSGFIR